MLYFSSKHGVSRLALLHRGSVWFGSAQYSLVAQSCLTLCDPMDCSTPGLPIHHQLPEFAQGLTDPNMAW